MDEISFAQSSYWFEALQSAVLLGGLIFSGLALRADTKSRRIGNLINLTSLHRKIWSDFYRRPELARIFKKQVDLARKPITDEEEMFVISLVLHLRAAYEAMMEGLVLKPHGLGKDVQWVFSFPITQIVWEGMKPLQDKEFVEFVEGCLATK